MEERLKYLMLKTWGFLKNKVEDADSGNDGDEEMEEHGW